MTTFPAIIPDHPATKELKVRETRTPLGDGREYVVRFGLNPVGTTWRLVWTRLDSTELFDIEQFLEARAADGEPFEWTPPDADAEQQFRVDQWEPARTTPTGWRLELVFRRVFDLALPQRFPGPTLLLHFDGENGSSTFTDSSVNNWSVTRYDVSGQLGTNTAQLTTSGQKFGTAQLILDGESDRIQTPSDNAFQIGTGDFTVDCWCQPTNPAQDRGLFNFGGNQLAVAVAGGSWFFCTFPPGAPAGTGSADQYTKTLMGPATSGQVHVALTRKLGLVRLFINGTKIGDTLLINDNYTGTRLTIGTYAVGFTSFQYDWLGTIDEFRYIKGFARWTNNFTPPTAPYLP